MRWTARVGRRRVVFGPGGARQGSCRSSRRRPCLVAGGEAEPMSGGCEKWRSRECGCRRAAMARAAVRCGVEDGDDCSVSGREEAGEMRASSGNMGGSSARLEMEGRRLGWRRRKGGQVRPASEKKGKGKEGSGLALACWSLRTVLGLQGAGRGLLQVARRRGGVVAARWLAAGATRAHGAKAAAQRAVDEQATRPVTAASFNGCATALDGSHRGGVE